MTQHTVALTTYGYWPCVSGLFAASFRLLDASALVRFVDTVLVAFGKYAVSIYGGLSQFLLTFALPVACVAYFPAAAMLGRMGALGVSPVLAYMAPLAGVLWFALGYGLWCRQLRGYQSAGH